MIYLYFSWGGTNVTNISLGGLKAIPIQNPSAKHQFDQNSTPVSTRKYGEKQTLLPDSQTWLAEKSTINDMDIMIYIYICVM